MQTGHCQQMGDPVLLIELFRLRFQSALISEKDSTKHCSFISHPGQELVFPLFPQTGKPFFSILYCRIIDFD